MVILRFNYHFYWLDQNYIYFPLTLSEHFSCLGLGNDSLFLPWSSKGDQLVLTQFHSLVARNRGDSSHIASDMPSQVSFSETCKTSRHQRYSLALTRSSSLHSPHEHLRPSEIMSEIIDSIATKNKGKKYCHIRRTRDYPKYFVQYRQGESSTKIATQAHLDLHQKQLRNQQSSIHNNSLSI